MPTPKVAQDFVADLVRQALVQCLPGYSGMEFPPSRASRRLFTSAKAQSIKKEIIDVGRKLWAREYVDGNGGNISYRIGRDHVLCTPTMLSKVDLTAADICLVNLKNEKIIGTRVHTSEILLHLEIYKAVPAARAVIHCHPPHATAYAITGLIPQGDVIPEQEVFVGPMAIAPYDTPGTKSFAETVLPYVQSHNTILLENHGVVCWADTVTHAEWCVEVVDTYCRTLILASQLGAPIRQISEAKISGLLEIKKRLGLPDARLKRPEKQLPIPPPQSTSDSGRGPRPVGRRSQAHREKAFEALVARITDQITRFASGD
jgi:L-fuculose-phosphate aldolase